MARAQVAVFAAFLLLGLVRVAPSLSWPMVYDDLHLVRAFTAAEIASAWRGNWDPDGVESPGFRPLSLLFNHLRASLFGENVAAHRIFVIVLYAVYLSLLVPVAARFGARAHTVLLAGVVMLAARYGVYHYVWITDGNHVLQGLTFAGSALLLLSGLAPPRAHRLVLGVACLGAGLLVREDTLAIVPALLLLGYLHARTQGRPALVALGAYAGSALLLSLLLLVHRGLVVPQASPPGVDLRSLAVGVVHALNPVGWNAYSRVSGLLVLWGWIALLGLAAGLVRYRREVDWRGPALWLACAVLTCAPALTLQRDNLLFFPGTFIALAHATAATALLRLRGAVRILAATGLAGTVAAATWMGVVFAENFHPDSSRWLWWNTQILYGEWAGRTTIPPTRRQAVTESLARFGIREGAQPRQRVRDLAAEAKAQGRRRPSVRGAVFVPLLPESF